MSEPKEQNEDKFSVSSGGSLDSVGKPVKKSNSLLKKSPQKKKVLSKK